MSIPGKNPVLRIPALLLILIGLPFGVSAQTNAPAPSPANAPTPSPTNAPTPSPPNAPTASPTNRPTNAGPAAASPQQPAVPGTAADAGKPAGSGSQTNPDSQPAKDMPRTVSWKKLIPNLLSDQKEIWLFPRKLKKKKVLFPTLAVLGVTAALIASDPTTGSYFRGSNSYSGFNTAFAGNHTSLGILIAPLAMYGAGLIKKNSKLQQTALFAGEAVAGSEILTTIFKDVDRRLRPRAIPIGGNFSDTWFEDNTNAFHSNGSFPSGHAIAAFSVATVFARQYGKEHKWVPWVAYGLAAAVGFSRMTLSAHFASDVFMGAALGYSISRFAVLRQ